MRGDTFAVTSSNRLVSFNRTAPATGSLANITGLRGGESIFGFDLRPGGTPANQMLAVSSMGGIYTIDPNSGVATLKTTMVADQTDNTDVFMSLTGTRVSIDVNNLVDRLRIVSDSRPEPAREHGHRRDHHRPAAHGRGRALQRHHRGCLHEQFQFRLSHDRVLPGHHVRSTADHRRCEHRHIDCRWQLTVDAAAMVGFDITTSADGTNNASPRSPSVTVLGYTPSISPPAPRRTSG